ncbi:hypothetical protein KBB74_02490 [Candidatus Parcubacteria bacterium]|nr:hypothetical protein [Candidatus Parcubacteria bacterium]
MLKKVLKTISVFILLILWIFSGWPVIWQNPRIPPEISKTLAATEDRQNYYAESTGVSTYNTNTNYQDKTTLSFTPDDNSTYLIIASWLMNENSGSYAVQGKLTRTTGTAKDFNELIYQPKDATDYIAGGAIGFDTFGSSPGSQTYKIQYKTSSTSGTASIKEAKIIAIKLNSSDKYAEQETRTTSSSKRPVDKTTLTFTPDSAGDYIVIATATGDGQSASYDFDIQLDIDGTSYSSVNVEPAYTANRYLWGAVKRINLTAASHTIKIQYNAESSATGRNAGIAHARIVALRADLFNNNYYAESENRVTTTSTSYQDKTTLTQTPLAQDHLIIGSANVDGSSSSYESYVQLIKSTTSYGEMLMETKDATTQGYPYFAIKKETLANSSTTWKVQYMSENSSNTAGIKDARISVIELRQPYITVGTSGTQMSNIEAPSTNSYIGGAFTFVRSTGSANITQIIINEEGTVNANSNLSNLDLYYETAGTCTYDGNETLFGTATSFNSSDQATITGTMAVGTSQVCVYAVLDVGSGASASETIEIEISVPGSDITVSSGVVAGASAVQISGTSTITKPYVTVGTTGTQTANVNYDSSNNYIGGAFTVVRGSGSTNITQIIINEEGTVNANSNLSNLDIYYETAGTCTYDGNETLFGTATSFNSSDQATITGTMAVGTSQVCVYAVLDVGSGASHNETIELEISNPSTDVTVSTGTVSGSSAVQISGTTTIVKPTITVGTTGTQTANLYNSTANSVLNPNALIYNQSYEKHKQKQRKRNKKIIAFHIR